MILLSQKFGNAGDHKMVILDYVTQTFWFKVSVSSGWFVYKLTDPEAISLLKKGYEFIANDIGAINEVSVELWIKRKGN